MGGSVQRTLFAAALAVLAVMSGALSGRHAATFAAGAAPAAQHGTESGNPDRVYTDAQAKRVEEVFTRSCGSCHGPREFATRLFQLSWAGRTLGEFYTKIRTTMPQDMPGTLTDQQYADVAAHVLQLNQYPTGDAELPPDATVLQTIKFRTDAP